MLLEEMNPLVRHVEFVHKIYCGSGLRRAYDHRIFYIRNGEGFIYLAEAKLPIANNDIVYIPSGALYNFEGTLSADVINFDLTQNCAHIKEVIRGIQPERFSQERIYEKELPVELNEPIVLEKMNSIDTLIDEMMFEFRRKTRESLIKASGLLKVILCDIVMRFKNQNTNPVAVKIMRHIQNNSAHNISNTEIAETFGYNHIYLNRIFKGEFGITIHRFLLSERISNAKKELRDSSNSVEEIAESCGFVSRTRFCTTFKKETGKTPNEYRQFSKNHHNNSQ